METGQAAGQLGLQEHRAIKEGQGWEWKEEFHPDRGMLEVRAHAQDFRWESQTTGLIEEFQKGKGFEFCL